MRRRERRGWKRWSERNKERGGRGEGKGEGRGDKGHLILMGLQSAFHVSVRPAVPQCLLSRFAHGFPCVPTRSSSLELVR